MSDTPRTDWQKIKWQRNNEAGCSAEFARNLERELSAARAELAKAHRRIHGDESEDCVFCDSKKQTPGGDDPQCYLCTMEAELAALRAEQAKPLDRPDKAGHWWYHRAGSKTWDHLYVGNPTLWADSNWKWSPATPPPAPKTEEETK